MLRRQIECISLLCVFMLAMFLIFILCCIGILLYIVLRYFCPSFSAEFILSPIFSSSISYLTYFAYVQSPFNVPSLLHIMIKHFFFSINHYYINGKTLSSISFNTLSALFCFLSFFRSSLFSRLSFSRLFSLVFLHCLSFLSLFISLSFFFSFFLCLFLSCIFLATSSKSS